MGIPAHFAHLLKGPHDAGYLLGADGLPAATARQRQPTTKGARDF